MKETKIIRLPGPRRSKGLLETTFYFESSLLEDVKIEFVDSYSKISKKYGFGIISNLLEQEDSTYFENTIKELDPRRFFARLFLDVGAKKVVFPCVWYHFNENNNAVCSMNSDKFNPLLEIECLYAPSILQYGLTFRLNECNFLPEYLIWDRHKSKERIVDNRDLYYLNTTRYNSYIREVKKLLKRIGITKSYFDALIGEFSKDTYFNEEEFIKISGEVLYYEDVYNLLKDNEKYRSFEKFNLS